MTQGFLSNPSISLLPDEKIIFKTNPHWLFLIIPILGIYLFLFIYFFFACPFLGRIDFNGLEGICYVIALFVFFFLTLIFYLDWRFNRLYLTNLRLIQERGIIGKRFMSIGLDRIEDITCDYGIWGRIFGFGDLIIESAGTYGKMTFKGMPSPKKIKWRVENEISKFSSKVS
jgi:uncharacterized membrane protein YdbT with pleckstrin-like domain